MPEIEINNISKQFGEICALTNVSIRVNANEFFGLIGPDGAGKTTLLRIVTTLLIADSGSVKLGDYDAVNDYKILRTKLGYMPGTFSLYQDLTVQENLQFFATVFGTTITENYDLIKDIYVQLEPFKKRRAGKLSGGMKQKLALCCALIHKPRFLILDEPTTGVDAVSRKEFWEMLHRLKETGITIIVSTPYMDEATQCDRVALMQDGRILKTDTPIAIIESFSHPLFAVQSSRFYDSLKALNTMTGLISAHAFGQEIHVSTKSKQIGAIEIQAFLAEKSIVSEIYPIEAGIEDCFMDLMQKQDG
jgi:ABC-type multidrug transport system ATPase subunit